MGEGVLVWDLRWMRGFLVWKKELVANLITVLNGVSMALYENMWSQKFDHNGFSSLNYSYVIISKPKHVSSLNYSYVIILKSKQVGGHRLGEEVQILGKCGIVGCPLRLQFFFWQLFQDMLPARQNIFSRRVIIDLNDMSYVFCGCSIESTCHLFVMCEFSLRCDIVSLGGQDWSLL